MSRSPARRLEDILLGDRLAHRYFDTTHAILTATVRDDLPELRAAVERLLEGTHRP